MCILSYIYGSNSLELGEDIELFYVVQDFCLVTVRVKWHAMHVTKALDKRLDGKVRASEAGVTKQFECAHSNSHGWGKRGAGDEPNMQQG